MDKKILRAAPGILIALLSLASDVRAETHEKTLSLPQAIDCALSNNPEIGELNATQSQTRHAVEETRSLRFPRLSLLGQYTTGDDKKTQLPDSNQAVARGEEFLFQGGRVAADIRRLENLEEGAVADIDVKKLQVVLDVEENYFQAVTDQEQIDLWTSAQEEYGKLLKLIEPKFSVGSVPDYDYVRIRLSIAQYEQEKLNSRRALEHDLFALGAAMGTDPPAAVEALPPVSPPPDLTLEKLLERLPQRPDLQAAEKRLSAEEFSVERAHRDRWPDLKLAGDYGYTGMTASDTSLGWGFSATANLPLYDFGTTHHGISRAEADRSAQEYKTKALRLRIRTEMNDALERVNSAWKIYRIAEESLPQAQKAYESSLRRYRTGLAPMTELSDAHDLLIQSRVHRSQSVNDYRNALGELDSVQGLFPAAQP